MNNSTLRAPTQQQFWNNENGNFSHCNWISFFYDGDDAVSPGKRCATGWRLEQKKGRIWK